MCSTNLGCAQLSPIRSGLKPKWLSVMCYFSPIVRALSTNILELRNPLPKLKRCKCEEICKTIVRASHLLFILHTASKQQGPPPIQSAPEKQPAQPRCSPAGQSRSLPMSNTTYLSKVLGRLNNKTYQKWLAQISPREMAPVIIITLKVFKG